MHETQGDVFFLTKCFKGCQNPKFVLLLMKLVSFLHFSLGYVLNLRLVITWIFAAKLTIT